MNLIIFCTSSVDFLYGQVTAVTTGHLVIFFTCIYSVDSVSDASDPDELDICVGRVRRVPTINKTTDLFALLQPIGRRVAPVARIVKWLFSRKYWFPSCIKSDQIRL